MFLCQIIDTALLVWLKELTSLAVYDICTTFHLNISVSLSTISVWSHKILCWSFHGYSGNLDRCDLAFFTFFLRSGRQTPGGLEVLGQQQQPPPHPQGKIIIIPYILLFLLWWLQVWMYITYTPVSYTHLLRKSAAASLSHDRASPSMPVSYTHLGYIVSFYNFF